MLNFDERTGPEGSLPADAYPSQWVPEWWSDAKIGVFIHWGLFSVPAWAETSGPVPPGRAYAHHRYAEWYGNTVRIEDAPARARHERLYGPGSSYEDFADSWRAEAFDAGTLMDLVARSGARYVVPVTKHHDGFCLWETATTPFNAARRGPRRDLIAELHEAAHFRSIPFGVYFSGALDWHASDFPPIESNDQLFDYRRNDEQFARYSMTQLRELIERFDPQLIWNDIDWPDAAKMPGAPRDIALNEFFHELAGRPNTVVNDRWGVPFLGFHTREYREIADTLPYPWESTRGLGRSFGFNAEEGPEDSLSGPELVSHVVDVVAKGGNVLINVGPRADGTIPALQREALEYLGAWLRAYGEAIYGTRPWVRCGEGEWGLEGASGCGGGGGLNSAVRSDGAVAPVRFTQSIDGARVYAMVDSRAGLFRVPREIQGCHVESVFDGARLRIEGDAVQLPDSRAEGPLSVLRFTLT